MMKRSLFVLLAAVLLTALLPARTAGSGGGFEFYDETQRTFSPVSCREVTVLLDGTELASPLPGLLTGGRVLVPLRALAEALGAEVVWDGAQRRAILSTADTTLILPLGSPTALVNGRIVSLPDGIGASIVRQGGVSRTMAPLRFVAEQLGAAAAWDGATSSAWIASAESAAAPEDFALPRSPGRFTIAIDPGHGGSATGASYQGVAEKEINLAVALLLRQRLEALGYRVIMTRQDDRDVGLYERCAIANTAGADIFISVHANAAVNNSAFQGLYTYHYPTSVRGSELARTVQGPACALTGAIDRGIASDNFVVVRETVMPAVLVETGFMSSPQELSRLTDPAYQNCLAWGIAEGAVRYLNTLT